MSLSPGVRLAAYEVLSLIGSGGMGEVYRARDVRLDRDVALKVLPAGLVGDPTRLQRFEQEARAAATLNHPNILAVFDIGQHEGAPYIVAELLEGETLRERLKDGALPVRKAVEYAIQIADGLAAAHDRGIVHRDLKPENIFVTSDGRVKILDFGLAKLTQAETSSVALSVLPTTPPDTLPGVVLGTAGYMAPEQVRGLSADHRADIFAFGVVLYELLSGQRAFRGDTAMDTMTAILREQPPELSLRDRHIPAALARVVDRCIEKNPAERFQSARDVAFAVAALSTPSGEGIAVAARSSGSRSVLQSARLAWSVATLAIALAVAIGIATYLRQMPAPAESAMRISILPVGNEIPTGVNPLALSPDGRQLAISSGGVLWIRRLDALEARPLTGTEGAQAPFWSPDGRFVAFFSAGKLKKISVSGGASITLCDAELVPAGGAWNVDDVIVFAGVSGAPGADIVHPVPIRRVSASGGAPEPVTTPDPAKGELWHLWPSFLPDGRHFVYFASGPRDPKAIYIGSLDTNEPKLLVQGGSNTVYAEGHLFYLRGTTLLAHAFDADRLQLTGEALPVADRLRVGGSSGVTGTFSVSRAALVYQTGENAPRLAWFDRSGQQVVFGQPANYHNVSLSPDRLRVLAAIADPTTSARDLWLIDTVQGSRTRFTFDAADENAGIWSPDGTRIVFNSSRKGYLDLYEKPSNLAGTEQMLFADESEKFPLSWSSDGRYLLYQSATRTELTSLHLWVLPLMGDRKPFRLFDGKDIDGQGQFSPDGRWIAYTAEPLTDNMLPGRNESTRPEIYVTAFPGPSGKWQISAAGGTHPRWRADGNEIFYLSLDARLMAVPISVRGGALEVGLGRSLFGLLLPPQPGPAVGRLSRQPLYSYEPAADGQRFLVRTILQETAPVTLIANWRALLTQTR